jgi:hypothetical protein
MRALSTILHLSATDDNYATTVNMSMLEVYNEKIRCCLFSHHVAATVAVEVWHDVMWYRDLLNLEDEAADLDVRMGKQGTYVDGLSEWPVANMEDALATIGRGASNRMVASNHVNEHSSRSHLVTLIKIERRHAVSGEVVSGYLYLVDLAGSERIKQTAATGQRLKEAQNINKYRTMEQRLCFFSNVVIFVMCCCQVVEFIGRRHCSACIRPEAHSLPQLQAHLPVAGRTAGELQGAHVCQREPHAPIRGRELVLSAVCLQMQVAVLCRLQPLYSETHTFGHFCYCDCRCVVYFQVSSVRTGEKNSDKLIKIEWEKMIFVKIFSHSAQQDVSSL